MTKNSLLSKTRDPFFVDMIKRKSGPIKKKKKEKREKNKIRKLIKEFSG